MAKKKRGRKRRRSGRRSSARGQNDGRGFRIASLFGDENRVECCGWVIPEGMNIYSPAKIIGESGRDPACQVLDDYLAGKPGESEAITSIFPRNSYDPGSTYYAETASPKNRHRYVLSLKHSEYEGPTDHEPLVLSWLQDQDICFRTPRPLAIIPSPKGAALVLKYMQGKRLDPDPGKAGVVAHTLTAAETAASLHNLDVSDIAEHLPGEASTGLFAEALLQTIDPELGSSDEIIEAALDWLHKFEPSDRAATMIHGSISRDHLLHYPGESVGLIDWRTCQLGDPAFELAYICAADMRMKRGNTISKRDLLAEYSEDARGTVLLRDVQFYQIIIQLIDLALSGRHRARRARNFLRTSLEQASRDSTSFKSGRHCAHTALPCRSRR